MLKIKIKEIYALFTKISLSCALGKENIIQLYTKNYVQEFKQEFFIQWNAPIVSTTILLDIAYWRFMILASLSESD